MSHVTMNLEHGKQVVGNWAHLQTSGMQGPCYEMKKLNTWAKGQQAACDTLPQALWHDLVTTTLFKENNDIVNK